MKTKLERIEKNEVALEIEVEADKVSRAINNAYRKMVTKVNIPGFRKGKVPRPVLEAYLGKEVLFEEALEEIIPEALGEAVKESEIQPVAEPKIDVVQVEDGKPLVFRANIVVKPEVKLGTLSGIEIEVPLIKVTDEDVDSRIEIMRNRYAQLVEVEDGIPAELGDLLTIDFTGYIGEESFPGGTGQDYSLELGSNTFIPGFEEQLLGAVNDEEREIRVTFPEDYQAEDLQGKEARFEVKVKEIKKRELSPLDDNFAQEVSDFSTLEELKEDTRKNLLELAENRKTQLIKGQVVKKAAEEAEFEVPQEMIEDQIDSSLQRFEQQLAYQGMKLADYLEVTSTSMEDMRQEFRPQAEQMVKESLTLEAIIKELDLKATEEDFEKELEKASRQFGIKEEEIRQQLGEIRPRLEYGILVDKAIDWLVENAVISEVEPNILEENQAEQETT